MNRRCPNCLREANIDRAYCCPEGGRSVGFICGYCGYSFKRMKNE